MPAQEYSTAAPPTLCWPVAAACVGVGDYARVVEPGRCPRLPPANQNPCTTRHGPMIGEPRGTSRGLEGDDGGEQAGGVGAAGEGAAELDGVHGYVFGGGVGRVAGVGSAGRAGQ